MLRALLKSKGYSSLAIECGVEMVVVAVVVL